MKNHKPFWSHFSQDYNELKSAVHYELMQAVLESEQDWKKHKENLNTFLSEWDTHSPSIVPNVSERSHEEVVKLNMDKLSETSKRVQTKIGYTYSMLSCAKKMDQVLTKLKTSLDTMSRYRSDIDISIIQQS